jgi:hypothetical protein
LIAFAVFAGGVVTVGAVNDWDYASLFSSIFWGSQHGELHQLAHTIRPEVREAFNAVAGEKNSGRYEIDVLGIAGDNRAFYMVFEMKDNTGRIKDLDFILQIYDFTPNSTGKSIVREANGGELIGDFFINYSAQYKPLSQTRNSVIYAVGFELSDLIFEPGYVHFMFYERVMSGDPYPDIHFFDVLIDYDFSAMRTFEVNEITNMPPWSNAEQDNDVPVMLKTVEITPIAVRLLLEYGEYNTDVKIKFKNGDALYSAHNIIHAHGSAVGLEQDEHGNTIVWGDYIYNIHFDTPYDLNEVYSVTVGDIEIPLN